MMLQSFSMIKWLKLLSVFLHTSMILAGLEVLHITNEPIAASLTYGFEKKNNKTIFVFDLGDGAFDVWWYQLCFLGKHYVKLIISMLSWFDFYLLYTSFGYFLWTSLTKSDVSQFSIYHCYCWWPQARETILTRPSLKSCALIYLTGIYCILIKFGEIFVSFGKIELSKIEACFLEATYENLKKY